MPNSGNLLKTVKSCHTNFNTVTFWMNKERPVNIYILANNRYIIDYL